jgi:hypothetical protein
MNLILLLIPGEFNPFLRGASVARWKALIQAGYLRVLPGSLAGW